MSNNALHIESEEVEGVNVLKLSGAIDTNSLNTFKGQLDALAGEPGAKVILDCDDLVYINSSSMGQIAGFQRKLEASGGKLALCRLQPKILQIMKLLELDRQIHICADREEAMQKLG